MAGIGLVACSTSAVYRNVNCGVCKEKISVEEINLPADALFKFDRYTQRDLLIKGRYQLDALAAQLVAQGEEINKISLIGHTDRMGSYAYNDVLGLNRAKTIRAYLKQRGVTADITVASKGEYVPITDGCYGLPVGQKLRDCLQPDRRVTVKIFKHTLTKACNACGVAPKKKIKTECEQCTYVDGVDTVALGSDSLFKFDKYRLGDLLVKGRAELDVLVQKLMTEYAAVKQVELIGHTDRKGSYVYNNVLGLNRAKTIRAYLQSKGVRAKITVGSKGEYQPVTNGCWNVVGQEEVKECLQPDRRVVVKIHNSKKVLKCTKCGESSPTKTLPTRNPQGDVFTLGSNTLFKFDKFKKEHVLPETLVELEKFSNTLKSTYERIKKIILIGHTDRKGSYAYNDALGLKRAKTVRTFLENKGITADIQVRSMGERQPVTNGCWNETGSIAVKACLQPDRRVEVRVFGEKKEKAAKVQQCTK